MNVALIMEDVNRLVQILTVATCTTAHVPLAICWMKMATIVVVSNGVILCALDYNEFCMSQISMSVLIKLMDVHRPVLTLLVAISVVVKQDIR